MSKPSRSPGKQVNAFYRYRFPSASKRLAIKSFFKSLDTPLSLSCWLLYEAGEMDQLVSKEIKPIDYIDVSKFRDDYAAISFLRKSEFVKTSFNLRKEALKVFIDSEQQCRTTNHRLRNLSSDPSFNGPNVWLLNATIRKVSRILGDVSAEELFDSGSFGPGVSSLIKGSDTSAVRKFREERHITASLYRLVGDLLPLAYPLWFTKEKVEDLVYREFSKVITVQKNAKTDRTIAVEPGINIWFQKAFGNIIRRRLLRNGLNLDDNGKNLALARRGSRDGTIATVDFKSASDTISIETVRALLPPKWFTLLDISRSRNYELGKDRSVFEKFSSMGNGFTFELESLIFYAAALATCEYCGCNLNEVSVFGDDVVLPVEAYEHFVKFASFLGFTVNMTKSFSTSMFRESCGGYYFNGADVKPFFFKKDLSNAKRVFNFANSVRAFAHRREIYGCDKAFKPLHGFIVRSLPKPLRVKVNITAGPGGIWSNFDEVNPTKLSDGLEGFSFKSFVYQAVELETDSPALLCARLKYTSGDKASKNRYPLRAVVSIRFCRMSVQQWYDWGPWL